jgi:hypothetical protein
LAANAAWLAKFDQHPLGGVASKPRSTEDFVGKPFGKDNPLEESFGEVCRTELRTLRATG